MQLRTMITVEFEGKSDAALTAALQRGLLGLRDGITQGILHAHTRIDTELVKITHSKPEFRSDGPF